MFALSQINSEELKTSILKSSNLIDEAINFQVPDEDIDGMVGKLNKLSSLTGTISSCYADASRLLRHKQLEVLKDLVKQGHQPSVANKLLDAECGDEEALFKYCDRLRSGLTSTIESLVTLISLWKTEYMQGNKEARIFKKK